MKPPDILLQCNSPQSLTSTMADIDQEMDRFQTTNNADGSSVTTMTNYGDQFSDRINNAIGRSNHDKFLGNDIQDNQYVTDQNRTTRKMSFSSLDGDPLPMTIQTLLQDLGDAMESPTRLIFDENILNDDEISRNLSDWAMT